MTLNPTRFAMGDKIKVGPLMAGLTDKDVLFTVTKITTKGEQEADVEGTVTFYGVRLGMAVCHCNKDDETWSMK